MPKGIPAAKFKSPTLRSANQLVPAGSSVYPGTECQDFPEGVPIPDGIRIRTTRGVEIRFVYDGERISETVRGTPTVAFVQEVARKRLRIQQLIGLGKFGPQEFAEEFPFSGRLKVEAEEVRPVTVGEALDQWYESRKNTFGPNTDDDHVRAIRNQLKPMKLPDGLFKNSDFVPPRKDYVPPVEWSLSRYQGGPVRSVDVNDVFILAHLPAASLSDVVINQIRTQLLKEVGMKRINNIMGALRGAVERLFHLGQIPRNPFDILKSLKKTKPGNVESLELSALDAPLPDPDSDTHINEEGEPDPFTKEEVIRILEQLDAPMANQMAFAFWSGLRTGETIALRRSDLQIDKNRICVRRSLSRGILKKTKTNKQRWVYLTPPAKAALLAQLDMFGAPDGWVFPNPFTKTRWANDSKITKRWKQALERANIRYRRPYQTRHTYASMMLSAGENIMYVASQMGHADWSMLVKVYGKWIPSGAATKAGDLVAQANDANWQHLFKLLQQRGNVAADESDYAEPEDELEPHVA